MRIIRFPGRGGRSQTSGRRPFRRGRHTGQFAQIVLVLLALGFAGSTLMRGPGYNAWLDGWLYSGVSLLSAAFCVARAIYRRNERSAWVLLGAGLCSYSIGNIYWAVVIAGDTSQSVLSLADAGKLAFYPLAYSAVILLMRDRLRQVPKSLWLDGIIGVLAAASLVSAVIFEDISRKAVGSDLAIIASLAYPIGDLLLLAIVVGCSALSGWRLDRSWMLVGMGLALFAVSDTGFLFATTHGLILEGTFADAVWAVGVACLGLAPWQPVQHVDSRVYERWTVIVMPIVFSCGALAVLTFDGTWHISGLATTLAVLAVLSGLVRLLLTFREVRALGESRRQARTDELTQLGNRRHFYEHLNSLLKKRNKNRSLALMLIDLDRFKEVNDTLGHHVGDMLLRQVGPRLREALRDDDDICRLGGDEFTVIIDGATAGAAAAAASRIRVALDSPFQLDGVPLRIAGSVGIALYPEHATEPNKLLQHADVAMYTAKLTGSGHQLYSPGKGPDGRERLRNIEELRMALEERRIVVHYQPKVDAETGQFCGVEALARLIHPTRGVIPPSEFLLLAEQTGLMRIFTEQVVEVVLDDCRQWTDQGLDIKVAINLSVTNLLDPDFPEFIKRSLASRELPGSCVVFEITESTVLSDMDRARAAVQQLRELGAETSLDDYGTGYASLAYLRQFPLNELKLDRTFVSNLDSDEISRAFVSSAVQLAHALGLRVVAEGIETVEMWEAVKAAGCDVCQGYYFARPLPREQLMEFVLARSVAT